MRSKVRKLLCMLATAVVCALLLELGLQLIHRAGFTSPLPYGLSTASPDAGRAERIGLKPGFVGTSRNGIVYSVNDMGFRDDPIEDGVRHIVFLGDSTTFGLNIRHEETFPELIERELRLRGHRVQCVNTATPGQATLDQRDLLRGLIDSGRLDIGAVVLSVFCNDFPGNMSYAGLRARRPEPMMKLSAPIRRMRSWRLLRELWKAARESRAHSRTASDGGAPPLDERREYAPNRGLEVELDWLTADELRSNRSFNITVEAIDELAELAQTLDLQVILVYMPTGEEEILAGRCPRYKELLHEHVSQRGDILWVDACEAYRCDLESGVTTILPTGYYSTGRDASHPGPEACAVLARELNDLLESQLGT